MPAARARSTTGAGIPVVVAVNGGTTAPNAFQLANTPVVGGFEYTLGRDSANQDWYLTSKPASTLADIQSSVTALAKSQFAQMVTGRLLELAAHWREPADQRLQLRRRLRLGRLFWPRREWAMEPQRSTDPARRRLLRPIFGPGRRRHQCPDRRGLASLRSYGLGPQPPVLRTWGRHIALYDGELLPFLREWVHHLDGQRIGHRSLGLGVRTRGLGRPVYADRRRRRPRRFGPGLAGRWRLFGAGHRRESVRRHLEFRRRFAICRAVWRAVHSSVLRPGRGERQRRLGLWLRQSVRVPSLCHRLRTRCAVPAPQLRLGGVWRAASPIASRSVSWPTRSFSERLAASPAERFT